MRPNEYDDLLKKIRCSDDFRSRMQEKLSAAPVEITEKDYEDSVSGIDLAPKHSWGRFAAIAAAFVLVCGAVGGGAYHFSKLKDKPEVNENIGGESIYDIVKANKESYDMSEYVWNYSAGTNILVRENSDYKDELFEYLDSLEGVREVENYPTSFRSVRFSFKDSKSGKRYDFSIREDGYGFWQETGEDENAALTSPNRETYYYGKKVFDKLFNKVLENADSETIEAMSMASQEEIMGFVSEHLENSDDKAVYYPWQSYNDSEIKEYSITDKTELINSLMKFEWVKIKESEFVYNNYYEMGIRISEDGYLMAVDEDPDPYGCYKLKYDEDKEKLVSAIKSVLEYAVDYSDVSSEDIKNALQKYSSETLIQWLSGPTAAPQGRDCYETTARYYTLNDGEGLINEIASFEWITCDNKEVENETYFKAYDGWMSLKGAYELGLSDYGYSGEAAIYPLGYMRIDERYYKLKKENDSERLAQVFDKYLVMEKESEIAEKICSGLTNYNNLKAHFTWETKYNENENQIIEGYMSYDAKNEKLYMQGDGHLSYQEKENTIELIMNGHDNSAFKSVEKDTGNTERLGTYRYSNGYTSPPPDNYVYLCKNLEKSLTPRFLDNYNSAKQNNYQITESDGKIELYSHGATDGCYTRIILTESGQLISYENIGTSYESIFKLDDYEFDSPDFTMEDVESIYESIKEEDEEEVRKAMENNS